MTFPVTHAPPPFNDFRMPLSPMQGWTFQTRITPGLSNAEYATVLVRSMAEQPVPVQTCRQFNRIIFCRMNNLYVPNISRAWFSARMCMNEDEETHGGPL